jgi:holo-[acyl-carrier protein] synthase
MIFGIGTDIVSIGRMDALWQRHGDRALARLLAPVERLQCQTSSQPSRFLAKRFAAKEAFGKALGTGIRAPALLTAIAIEHDESGKPSFSLGGELSAYLAERGLTAHLSLSDEQNYAVAFVVMERQ